MRVAVVIDIRPGTGGGVWDRFFEEHSHVKRVEWSGSREGWTDLVVFFDSDEPFPISSLRTDSPVRESLLKICG